MIKSESITQLAQALCLAQGQMRPAEMNKTNPFLKNRYADLGSIIAAAREPLAANGLSFTQVLLGGDGGDMTIETMLMHKSGEYIGSDVIVQIPPAEKGRSAAQEAGAVITYFRRYALSALLGIYADEDSDGQETGNKKPSKPEQERKGKEYPEPSSVIELAAAEKVTTSEGVEYGTMETYVLDKVLHGLDVAIAKNGLTDERKAELNYKRDAASTILRSREG